MQDRRWGRKGPGVCLVTVISSPAHCHPQEGWGLELQKGDLHRFGGSKGQQRSQTCCLTLLWHTTHLLISSASGSIEPTRHGPSCVDASVRKKLIIFLHVELTVSWDGQDSSQLSKNTVSVYLQGDQTMSAESGHISESG